MPTSAADAKRDAERILDEVWRKDENGFLLLPVDPVAIARKYGIDVVETPLESSLSGALIKERGQDPTIVVNSTDSPNRKRFTCAHELGHFVLRSDAPDAYSYIDYRDIFSSSAGRDPSERYSNAFAAALLMPESEVRRLDAEGYDELRMSYVFNVSRESMHYRLDNLGLLRRR